MLTTRFVRQMAFFSLLTIISTSFVLAQPPQDGGGGRQDGGGGRQGGGGAFGGRGFGGQGGGPGGMMGGPRIDRAALLRIDKVRQELKIEEAQAATIDAALEAYNEERNSSPRPDRDAFEKMTEEERTKYFEESGKKREELSKKTDEILVALLEEPQAKRLDEIAIQIRLTMSATATLKADDMKQKLTVTDEQVAKLDAVEKEADASRQKAFQEMFAGGQGGDREAMRTKMGEMMADMQKKNTEAAMSVMTDDQKKTLDGLKGAAFEINLRDMMGGRGGFGGQGGAPGGGGGAPGGGGGAPGGGRGRGGRPPAE